LSKAFLERIECLESQDRDRKWNFFTPFLGQLGKKNRLIPDLINHSFWYTNDIYLKQIIINMDMGNSRITYWPASVCDPNKNLELTTAELVEFVFRVHEDIIEGESINLDSENKAEEILVNCLENQLKSHELRQEDFEITLALLIVLREIDLNEPKVLSSRTIVRDSTCGVGKELIEKLISEGIQILDIKTENEKGILLEHYVEKWIFSIQEIFPKGGQILICPTKSDGDQVFDYYDSLASLAGPHLYRSSCGKVIAQLNNGLSKETGNLFRKVLLGFNLP
jgi:hypothetical protein